MTCKRSQTQQVNTQTGFPDQKSDLPLLNYWFETGVLRVMNSSVQFKTDYCIAIIKKKLYN